MVFIFPELKYIYSGAQTANKALELYDEWEENHPSIMTDGDFLINFEAKVAILTQSPRWKGINSRTLGYRIGRDHTKNDRPMYFRTYKTVTQLVSKFFQKYPEYHLMVDVQNGSHQCMLYIVRNPNGLYSFYAYDPNQGEVADMLRNFAKKISTRVEFMAVWTSHSLNKPGLCYSLTWRFIHLIMYEGYNPILNERIGLKYYFTAKRKEIVTDDRRQSSVGFVRPTGNYQLVIVYPQQ